MDNNHMKKQEEMFKKFEAERLKTINTKVAKKHADGTFLTNYICTIENTKP